MINSNCHVISYHLTVIAAYCLNIGHIAFLTPPPHCRRQFSHKLCSRLSSSEVRFYTEISHFAFLSHPLGDLGATYEDVFRLTEKRVIDFLSVLLNFFARC